MMVFRCLRIRMFFFGWLFFQTKTSAKSNKISGDFHQLTKKNLKVICREKLFGEGGGMRFLDAKCRSPYSEGIPKEGNFLG